MNIGSPAARPWHVSDALRTAGPRDDNGPAPGPQSGVTAPPPVIAPLWRRVVTGQVIWWRVRRLLNGLLWRRRRAARRAVLQLDRHPEFRHVLATEGLASLGAFTISVVRSSRAARPTRPTQRGRYRPTVEVPSDLDITGLRRAVALSGVEIRHHPVHPARARADLHDPLIVVQSADPDEADIGFQMLDAIDISTWNPLWFQLSPNPYTVRLSELPRGRQRRKVRARASVANRSRVVVCDTADDRGSVETAQTIAQLAASGAPLVGHIAEDVADLVGPDITDTIRTARAADLTDNGRRERHSVTLRRAALETFSPRGRWRRIGDACGSPAAATPSVTVLLASNRADDVIGAARQIAAQRGCAVQLVVGLHGSHMSPQLDDELADAFTGDLVVRHLPDEANLGQVMNALTAEADGELVAKWDDDDWYDSLHLTDLITALEYSGASLVAKAAEFVYLEALDLTVRRFATGSERWSTTVAGGTMLLTRHELQQVGWADAPRRIDRLLIDAIEGRAGTVYRTHGFGYVLRRRSAALGSHTWQAGDAYFLRQSIDQRPGLDLAFAGFTGHAATRAAS